MNIKELLGANADDVWSQYVPIVSDKHHTDIYITDGIEEPSSYNEMCHTLRAADRADTVTIHLNTPGGIIDSAFMIVDAIKSSKATVTAYLSGTVASAGTIIALACDKLIVSDHTSWMSHNYSGGMMGKGHEMKARQEFMDSSLKDAFHDFYAGFFDEDEMKSVIDGKDIWIGKTEILQRWDNRKAYLRGLKVLDKDK